jgi:rRNA-processing protein FCF1
MMEHPLPQDRLPELVAKATDPRLSTGRKLAVARGIMPMSPENLLLALYQLCHDPDEDVERVARDTVQGMPAEMVKNALRKLDMAEPLDFYAGVFSAQVERMEAILLNRATSDESVERVARRCMKNVADLVASNQERLLRRPGIIEALYLNKNTRMSTVDRVITFAIRNGLVLEGIPAFKELAAAIGADVRSGRSEAPPAQARALDQRFDAISTRVREQAEDEDSLEFVDSVPCQADLFDDSVFDEFDGGLMAGTGWDVLSEFDRDITGSAEPTDEDGSLSLNYQVSTLNVAQKIRLAILGNAAHRALLISDTNKLVAMAAIKSPSITDQEVMRYAQSRSVSEEVIRHIATKREWTRNYFVKVGLVNNPKTPLPTAMSLLIHLRPHDLRSLMRNKNVPAGLTQAAKIIVRRQEQSRK